MRNQDVIKVAGFLNHLKHSLSQDNPDQGRTAHALALGTAGAGLGGWLGYNKALNTAMADPFGNVDIWGHIGGKPGALEDLFKAAPTNLAGKVQEFGRMHGRTLPAIAKLRTGKMLLPALLAGGLGTAVGAMIPGKTQTPQDRMEKLWARRPDLLK